MASELIIVITVINEIMKELKGTKTEANLDCFCG